MRSAGSCCAEALMRQAGPMGSRHHALCVNVLGFGRSRPQIRRACCGFVQDMVRHAGRLTGTCWFHPLWARHQGGLADSAQRAVDRSPGHASGHRRGHGMSDGWTTQSIGQVLLSGGSAHQRHRPACLLAMVRPCRASSTAGSHCGPLAVGAHGLSMRYRSRCRPRPQRFDSDKARPWPGSVSPVILRALARIPAEPLETIRPGSSAAPQRERKRATLRTLGAPAARQSARCSRLRTSVGSASGRGALVAPRRIGIARRGLRRVCSGVPRDIWLPVGVCARWRCGLQGAHAICGVDRLWSCSPGGGRPNTWPDLASQSSGFDYVRCVSR